MQQALLFLAVLACPVGMGLMMFFMGRGAMGGHRGRAASTQEANTEDAADPESGNDVADEPSLAELKAEHARLGAQIDQLDAKREPAGRR